MRYGILPDGDYQYKWFKDALWLKIFDHNLNYSQDFVDENEALSCNKPYKYSILKEIELLGDAAKYQKDKLEFLIEYPQEQNKFNWWRQFQFPTKEDEILKQKQVKGYEDVLISWKNNSWGGLAKTIHNLFKGEENECLPCLLDGSVGTESWFYSIGKYDCSYTYSKQYPFYSPPYDQVILWLRVKPCPKITCYCNQNRRISYMLLILLLK